MTEDSTGEDLMTVTEFLTTYLRIAVEEFESGTRKMPPRSLEQWWDTWFVLTRVGK